MAKAQRQANTLCRQVTDPGDQRKRIDKLLFGDWERDWQRDGGVPNGLFIELTGLLTETWQKVASPGEKPSNMTTEVEKAQVLTLSRNGKRRRVLATPGESEGEGTRTPNHRIDSPVL